MLGGLSAGLIIKQALEERRGDIVGRTLSNTLGRIGALPTMLGFSGAQHSPIGTPESAQEHRAIMEDMARVRPEQLSRTVVRHDAPHFFGDLARTLTNPRTGPIGKVLGTITHPINYALATLTRGPHYNPYADTVVSPMRNPAVLSHELGHAVDYNDSPLAKTMLGRLGKGTVRDVYGVLSRLPGAVLYNEAMANSKSWKSLQEANKDNPDRLAKLDYQRTSALPAGYASYAGAHIGVNPLLAMILARLPSKQWAYERAKMYQKKDDKATKKD